MRDRVVLITGAAGGAGAELTRRLHARGARLVLTDLTAASLAELAGPLDADRVLTRAADVRDPAAVQAVADAAVERFGGIDVVVANAGIATYGSVLRVDPDAFKQLVDVNVVGVFNTVRAALPAVIERRGYVLIVSSLAAFAAAPGMAPYDAAKAAVEHFANALRMEVAHLGVAVGSAHMSWIDTPMVRDAKDDLPAFRRMLATLPGPLSRTTSVSACGAAFVKGIEGRKARIYCPRWVGLMRWLKPLLSTRVGMAPVLRTAPELIAQMDEQVAALGRSTSARFTD